MAIWDPSQEQAEMLWLGQMAEAEQKGVAEDAPGQHAPLDKGMRAGLR